MTPILEGIIVMLIILIITIITYFWVSSIDSSSDYEKKVIRNFVDEHGRSPSSEELVKLMGGSY